MTTVFIPRPRDNGMDFLLEPLDQLAVRVNKRLLGFEFCNDHLLDSKIR